MNTQAALRPIEPYNWSVRAEAQPEPPSLAEAVKRLLEAKEASNKSQKYVTALRILLGQFQRFTGDVPLSQITVDVLDAWFNSRKWQMPATQLTELNRLSALFSFAVRRRWIASNPCDQVERLTIDCKPPRILTPAEADKLLKGCPGRLVPWVVLGMFCGLRPQAEIERLERA
ncbi:MAG TPA: phage integrase SAM-like domain-containing protein, partial [Candidatus Acidoferrum sp.]|nr:phage integrase SAM-like domain-containing protein [Candidatus Acidoferrum sp.]